MKNWRSWLKWIGFGAQIAAPIVEAKKPGAGKLIQVGADAAKSASQIEKPKRRMSEADANRQRIFDSSEGTK
jgi:hypothetical protein